MRLMIVTRETASDRRYGIGQSIGRLADELAQRRYPVRYVCQADCEPLHAHWRPRFTRWLSALGAGAAAPALAERCVQGMWAASEALRWNATLVWVQDPWLVLGLQLGLLRRKRFKRPFKLVVSEHGLGAFTHAVTLDGLALGQRQYRWLLAFEKRVLQRADAVLCPTQAVQQALLRDLQLASAPPHFNVIGYGKPEREGPVPTPVPRAPHQPPVVLAVGRLAPVKRHATLVHAAALLEHEYHLPVQLRFAGDGDPSALLALAREQGLTYAPICGPATPIEQALDNADIYVSACSVEAFGLANREALAAGLPSVIAAGGANDEVLGNGAWLVNGQPGTIANSLAALLNQPALYAHWQQQARYAAAQWPGWRTLADVYETFFFELTYG